MTIPVRDILSGLPNTAFHHFLFLCSRGHTWPRIIIGRNSRLIFDRKSLVFFGLDIQVQSSCLIKACSGSRLSFGRNVFINSNSYIVSMESISIGDYAMIAPNVVIVDHNHRCSSSNPLPYMRQGFETAPIEIGRNCWICANSVILPGSKIGEGSIVAAGSVVRGVIPDYQIWGGIPAKKIKDVSR